MGTINGERRPDAAAVDGARDSVARDAVPPPDKTEEADVAATPDLPVVVVDTRPPAVDTAPPVDSGPAVMDAIVDRAAPAEKLAVGMACTAATMCNSGFCIDGVCCGTRCDGICQTCAEATALGTCRPARAGTDPGNECADEGARTCGRDGMCDGAQACRRYPANTECAPATCAAGTATAASRCDAMNVCQPGAMTSCLPYACAMGAAVPCKILCVTKADCAGTAECFNGRCGGLQATYFATVNLMGRSITRIDPNVDFNLALGPPEASMPVDMFSARWVGKITPPADGVYTFYTESDDGTALWVNDQMLVNQWKIQSVMSASGQVTLKARQPVNIKLEYFDDHGDAVVRLLWSGPNVTKQIVPTIVLSP